MSEANKDVISRFFRATAHAKPNHPLCNPDGYPFGYAPESDGADWVTVEEMRDALEEMDYANRQLDEVITQQQHELDLYQDETTKLSSPHNIVAERLRQLAAVRGLGFEGKLISEILLELSLDHQRLIALARWFTRIVVKDASGDRTVLTKLDLGGPSEEDLAVLRDTCDFLLLAAARK